MLLTGAGPLPGSPRFAQALTAAALALPGLAGLVGASPAVAADQQFSLQNAQLREQGPAGPEGPAPVLSVDALSLQGRTRLANDDELSLRATQDTWSGATPVATAPLSARTNRPVWAGSAGSLVTVGASPMLTSRVVVDRSLRPLATDANGRLTGGLDTQVHTYSEASPETRRQLDLGLRRRVGAAQWQWGLGLSDERDHESHTLRGSHSWQDADAQTTYTAGLQLTRQHIRATLDHDATPYLNTTAWREQLRAVNGQLVFEGQREELGANLGLVRILDTASWLQADLGVLSQRGDLSNPYKAVSTLFVDPAALASGSVTASANLQALMEKRPSSRQQWQLGLKWVHHHAPTDAALRLAWRHARDSWGVRSHALEGEWAQPLAGGWLVTPRLRYYTQTAAYFYTPWLATAQAYRSVSVGPNGQVVLTPFNPALLPAHYSSDARLGGYGSLTLGVSVARDLAPGVVAHAGVDWTRQSGRLKAGGAGLGAFADWRWMSAHVGLTVQLDTLGAERAQRRAVPQAHAEHGGEAAQAHHHAPGWGGNLPPPGVQGGHWLAPGQWHLGHSVQLWRQGGALQRGGQPLSDAQVLTQACGPLRCQTRPDSMHMRMQMLHLMVGVNDDLNLMVMPHYMDMAMHSTRVAGATADLGSPVHVGRHESGGWGDTQVWVLSAPHQGQNWQAQWSAGLSLPTGASGVRMRRTHQTDPAYLHYDMQLGSGTWDALVGTHWQRGQGPWQWGGQVLGTVRLQKTNAHGYALGPRWQGDLWLARTLAPGWQLSGRWQRVYQGAVRGALGGQATGTSPGDWAHNQGGRSDDLVLALRFSPLAGPWAGSGWHLAWSAPVGSQLRGVQLQRRPGLSVGGVFHF